MVGKSNSKENPKSNLDLDLGFVNFVKIARVPNQYSAPNLAQGTNIIPLPHPGISEEYIPLELIYI